MKNKTKAEGKLKKANIKHIKVILKNPKNKNKKKNHKMGKTKVK